VFEGACYTTPVLGAVLADSLWGRYKTILVFSLIYLLVSCADTFAGLCAAQA
jgi:dipeptide/tripeptide permease